MNGRARLFVEHWIAEFLHPDLYEDEETFSESRQNAALCRQDAARYGIAGAEIDAAFADLVAHFARMHERIVDSQLRHPAGQEPSAVAA